MTNWEADSALVWITARFGASGPFRLWLVPPIRAIWRSGMTRTIDTVRADEISCPTSLYWVHARRLSLIACASKVNDFF